jgi:deoxyribodipyrimidine photo-lyase
LTILHDFLDLKLQDYSRRNDPNLNVVSGLSPYLHFGQVSAQSVALAVKKAAAENPVYKAQADEFLEELIVRRELSDNYCFYNADYDNCKGWPEWAKKTLDKHKNDLRVNKYSKEQLEQGLTHDKLWNAAQKNLLLTNSIPGYLRMYWAKKILEWSPDAETAQAWAIEFNDRYMLDGRDPNGYTGIAWSVAGVHDRPWAERPVFGMIRYMSLSGCQRKFDVDQWIGDCCLL